MGERFFSAVRTFDASYGTVAIWIWRLILYPVLLLGIYAGISYLNNHYVSKEYFDRAMSNLSDEKARYAAEQKQDLKEIIGKLDTLLQGSAVSSQRFTETERRLSRLEDHARP